MKNMNNHTNKIDKKNEYKLLNQNKLNKLDNQNTV